MTEGCDNSKPIVTTEWLATHLNYHSIIVVEIDADPVADYDKGHVAGAVCWNLHTDMENQLTRDIPSVEQFEELMGSSGIDNETTVVLYGDGNNRSATWAFWVMKYYGHKDVRLVDGGRKKWVSEGRPLSTNDPEVSPKRYSVGLPDQGIRATKEYVEKRLGLDEVKILDTRTHEEFVGELTSAPGTPQPDIYRKGRIPGAIHAPWDQVAAEDGSFRSVKEIRNIYDTRGINSSSEVITYCRLGMRASYSWFVLKYLLGYQSVVNYDGSWTEWGNSIGVPIETGPTG